ncbi:MAG: hypothetical protein VKM92_00340 [Cyanobacteriota bacterium]|nr:hypothetical protein [Cyanobacteriota bacterium]
MKALYMDELNGPQQLMAIAHAAAALRTAIDQVAPLYVCNTTTTRGKTRLGLRTKLLAIAAELEGAQ